ncbi:hypothetical protein QW131_13105 [Roseibium salinum]|nr:hypothetical protein [Roseibium salinum]
MQRLRGGIEERLGQRDMGDIAVNVDIVIRLEQRQAEFLAVQCRDNGT